jgi:putative transposase
MIVMWNGGSSHKGPAVWKFLARNKRLRLERLPAYSPDLNPVEAVWSWLKYGKLANFVLAEVTDLDDLVLEHLIARKSDPGLLRQLWNGSELPFPAHNLKHPGQPAEQ